MIAGQLRGRPAAPFSDFPEVGAAYERPSRRLRAHARRIGQRLAVLTDDDKPIVGEALVEGRETPGASTLRWSQQVRLRRGSGGPAGFPAGHPRPLRRRLLACAKAVRHVVRDSGAQLPGQLDQRSSITPPSKARCPTARTSGEDDSVEQKAKPFTSRPDHVAATEALLTLHGDALDQDTALIHPPSGISTRTPPPRRRRSRGRSPAACSPSIRPQSWRFGA